jgi:hypothetical protein
MVAILFYYNYGVQACGTALAQTSIGKFRRRRGIHYFPDEANDAQPCLLLWRRILVPARYVLDDDCDRWIAFRSRIARQSSAFSGLHQYWNLATAAFYGAPAYEFKNPTTAQSGMDANSR